MAPELVGRVLGSMANHDKFDLYTLQMAIDRLSTEACAPGEADEMLGGWAAVRKPNRKRRFFR